MNHRLFLVIFLPVASLLGACGPDDVSNQVVPKNKSQASKEDSGLPPLDRRFYKGCQQDLLAFRTTARLPKQTSRGASVESVQAAARIFKRIDFVAMTKKEVLSLLGDPATVNEYGIAARPGDNSPLEYRMDTGFGGLQYTLEFKNGKVQELRVESQD